MSEVHEADVRDVVRPREAPELPVSAAPAEAEVDYHGVAPIKAPPWLWYVPAYFWLGGMAGAANLLGATVQLDGDPALRPLVVRCRRLGAVAVTVGSVLLIADLGRPVRFLYMIRVFRPTSPMNVGTWSIGASGIAGSFAAVAPGRAGDAAGLLAGALGPILSTYTSMVLSNTVIPVWQAQKAMPLLFGGSSAAAAGWALALFGSARERRIARRLALVGQGVELGAAALVERELGARRARPLQRGAWRTGKWLGAACLVAAAAGQGRLAAGLGLAATAAVRFGLLGAAPASAADPQATFRPDGE